MGARRSLTRDIGATGLNETWGYIRDDFLNEWNGAEKVKRIDEMLRSSPEIGALRMAIEMTIRSVSWQFVSDAGEDDPRLELVRAAADNMTHSLNDHIVDALLFPFYGWSMFTITYERVDGRLLWRKFKFLGHDTVMRWLMDEEGGLVGLQQWPHLNKDIIPIERMLIYRLRKPRNNPEGESILRPAWPSWYYLKNIQQIEAIGIERNINGLPVIQPPMSADMSSGSTDKTTADEIVRNVRNDEQAGLVLPPPSGTGDENKWHFSLLSGGGASKVIDTDIVISRYAKRILMAALSQFLMLGQDNVGSLALSSDQTDFFTLSANAMADIIQETFSKYAIARLLRLNGLDEDGITLEHSPAGDIDILQVADFLQKSGSLITWTAKDESWLRAVARMPEMEADEIEQLRQEKQAQQDAKEQARLAAMANRPIAPNGNGQQQMSIDPATYWENY